MFESLKNSLRSILTYSNSSSTISQIFKIIFIKTFFEEYLDMEIFNITSIIALKLGKKSYFGCATLDTIVWKIIFKVWWGGSPDETRIYSIVIFLSNYTAEPWVITRKSVRNCRNWRDKLNFQFPWNLIKVAHNLFREYFYSLDNL